MRKVRAIRVHAVRRIICLAAVLVAGLMSGVLAGGCRKQAPADLVILSPHHNNAQTEFGRAFDAWHRQKYGSGVTISWLDVGGGSSAMTRHLVELYAHADRGDIDLYFGGGAPDHKLLADKGITVPVELPAEILAALPKTIGGVQQIDPGKRWYGAAVSCFGILYNAKLLKQNDLPIPATWDDLAAPAMFRRVEVADGTESGSARTAFEMIVQSAGSWPDGWGKLIRIYANAKKIPAGASSVATDVANGEVLAGTAIDFYAFTQIAQFGDDLGFAVVSGSTAFTPDPIAMLKGGPHPEMAKRFMEFVLSPEGQALWCLPAGTPDGPALHSLYRQPIRRDVYEKYKGLMLAPLVDPFAASGDFKLDEKMADLRISRLHGPLMSAAAIANRDDLGRAWKAIIDAGQPADLLAELTALPPELADEKRLAETADRLADEKQRAEMTLAWQIFFREKYRKIIAQAAKR